MSSSRLAKLRNRAGAGNPSLPNRNMQQQQQQQQQQQPRQQQNGNVNPMQILQWHETRLKDLLQRFEYLDAKTESLAEMNVDAGKSNNSKNDANNLLVVNDILDRINKLSQRVDAVEVLTRNLKDDYLTYKNGTTENKVELIVNDKGNRINEVKKAENVVQETKAEMKEIKQTLERLKIEPTHSDVKKVTFEAPVARGEPMGFDGGSMDLTGSAI